MVFIFSIGMIITFMMNASDNHAPTVPPSLWLKGDPELKQKIAAHLFEESKDIEKIKSFYQEAQRSYNDPYYVKKSYAKKHAKYPLSWALKNDLDFALWLVKDQKVDTSYISKYGISYFHRLAKVMKNDGPLVHYAELIKSVVENKGAINSLNNADHTPLMTYMNANQHYNPEIIKLFFAYGAHIVDHRGKHLFIDANKSWFRGLQGLLTCKGGPRIIPYLFKMKLDTESAFTGVNYRNSLCYAKEKYDTYYRLLSLWSKRTLKGTMPKPLIHILCKLAVRDYEDSKEIAGSIETFRSWEEHWDKEGKNQIIDNPLFKQIMTPSFWDNPLPVCYEALDALVQIKN